MSCADFERDLAALALEETRPGSADVFAHLAACPACRGALEAMRRTGEALRAAAPDPDPARSVRLAGALREPRLRLSFPEGERTFLPGDLPVQIGRGAACAVRLEDPGCSRQHAELRWAGGRFALRDLGSANGTRLNGKPAELEALSDGDRIGIGGAELGVSVARPPALLPPEGAARLRLVVQGPAGSWIHEVQKDEEFAGRGGDADLRLDDKGCSRRHLALLRSGGALAFRDLGSANGTRLNGQPAREGALKPGDVLELGGSRLAFHPVGEGQRGGAASGIEFALTFGGETEVFEMGQPVVVVGRSRDCDLRVKDPAGSRRQLRLEQRPDGLWVTDLGSSNPTRRNGSPVREARLDPGDVLAFGGTELRYLPPEAAPAEAAAGLAPDLPLDDSLAARPRRTLITRRKPAGPSQGLAAGLILLGGLTGVGLALLVAKQLQSRAAPAAPQAGSSAPAPLPPPAPARSPSEEAAALLAAVRGREASAPGDREALLQAYEELARRFPGTPAAEQAREAVRALRAARAKAQDAAWEELLAAVDAARAAGDLRSARARLLAFQESDAATAHGGALQRRLADLDQEMERDFEARAGAALDAARQGRFAEARTGLAELQARYAGLPWGSAVDTRLADVDGLERAAAVRQEAEQARLRAEAEAKRTDEERARLRAEWAANQAVLKELLKGLPAKTRAQRETLFGSLVDLDPGLDPKLVEGILSEQRYALSRLRSRLNGAAVQALRADLKGNLDDRRKEALALILDPVKYPYLHDKPDRYGPDGEKIQREVDGLVARVEEAWTPAKAVLDRLRKSKGLDGILDALAESEGYLARLGKPVAVEASAPGLLSKAVKIDFAQEAAAAKENAQILAEVEAEAKGMLAKGALDGEELACIRITNGYRIMMGMRPLRIDPRLCAAARGHSRDMTERNYFAHVDPDGRGPGERARAQGFAGPVGENINFGYPTGEASFLGWRSSSGHHRNMLQPQWTVIGVGRHGGRNTMLLGN